MKIFLTHYLLLISSFVFYAQQRLETDSISNNKSKFNPIAFYEFYGGFGGSINEGFWIFGTNFNYEFSKSNLFTLRYTYLYGANPNSILFFPYSTLIYKKREEQNEFAFLYGKRWTNKGISFSVSMGVSYVYRKNYELNDNIIYRNNQNYLGLPIELNVKFFKKNKQIFRAYYGLIPIGKRKVSFGRSVGFKLIGNFSKEQYLGLGITYGLGWHKKY